MSQLLSRLEAELARTTDSIAAAEIQVKRSCYLSRTGYFNESRALIADLRRDFGAGQNARIPIWIMLAEGIAELFENIGAAAKDRISRAQLIALAVKDRELGAITSAWRAHLDFEVSDFESMGRSLKTAFELADRANNDARARIAMVMANCFFLLGDRERAQKWFLRCRDHAIEAGDQASTDALLYNRAAFGLAWLRVQWSLGNLDQRLVSLVHLEIQSAKNFQAMTADLALSHLVTLCEARILFLKLNFTQALETFAAVRPAKPFADYNFSLEMIDLEQALCLAHLGRIADAMDRIGGMGVMKLSRFDIDDQLVLVAIRRDLIKIDPAFGEKISFVEDSSRVEASYREKTSLLASICFALDDGFDQLLGGERY